MNCTYIYVGEKHYIIFQNIVFLGIILIGIVLNLTTVVTTIRSTSLCFCSTSRLFLSSYLGNMSGLASLGINGVYTSKSGIPNINCRSRLDQHFFLYLGFTVNMFMLVNSTYNRYRAISNLKNLSRVESNRNLFLWYVLPAWIISFSIAILIMFINLNQSPFIVCGAISIIPITICIIINLHLKLFLNKMKRNAELTQQTQSLKNISIAISMLRLTAVWHGIYLLTGFLVTLFLKKYSKNATVFITLDWASRILYDLVFTVEAKAFLIKQSSARKDISKFFYHLYTRKNKLKSSVFSTTVTSFS